MTNEAEPIANMTTPDDAYLRAHGAICSICNERAPICGLICVGPDVEAWRFDCPNGHTTLICYTTDLPEGNDDR